MEYTYLGRTGMIVSRLALGTMNFGSTNSEKESFEIMDRALELGINLFDCANIYGREHPVEAERRTGIAEEILGRWFAQGGDRRERTVLATKVYIRMNDPLDGPNDKSGLSLYKMRRHLKGSLERLQTDHIELYQMHHVDERTTWDEVWGAFQPMVESGVVDYIGSCNFGARHLCWAQEAAKERHFMGLVSEQSSYNLTQRAIELELLPAAQKMGIGVLTWGPLGGGMLSGHVLDSKFGTRGYDRLQALTPAKRQQLQDFSDVCRDLGEKESEVALAWILANPAVTAPLIGPRTVEQLESSVHALEIKLSEDTMRQLNEIFPGPGGPAPQAYAW